MDNSGNSSPKKWWVLLAMGLTLGIVVLDETIVGVALPTMQHDLNMSVLTGHWVVNAYLIVLTGLSAVAGKSSDIFGYRKLFVVGLVIFCIGSLLCGFSQSSTWLISSRIVQGIGAAIVFPSTIAMVSIVFPEHQRGLALGIYTAFGGIFMSLGPLLGGLFSEELSWRWIFWINLPVIIAIAILFLVTWREPERTRQEGKIDVVGVLTFVLSIMTITVGIMQGVDWGWDSPAILSLLIGGMAIFAFFVYHELNVNAPLFELRLFINPIVKAGNIIVFIGQYNKVSIVIYTAAYLQHAVGFTPIQAGLGLLAAMLPLLPSPVIAGRLTDKYGSRWPMLGGLAISGTGILLIGLALPMKSYGLIILPLVMWGCTLPFHYVPSRKAIMGSVSPQQRGEASGLTMTVQLLGGAMGIAIGSAALAITGSFASILYVSAGLSLVVWLYAWRMSVQMKTMNP